MAMMHDITLTFYLESNKDQSELIKKTVGFYHPDDGFQWNDNFTHRKNSYVQLEKYSRYEEEYEVSYSSRGYFDYGTVIDYAEQLAKALPHCCFCVEARVFNEGSGGNYHDEMDVTYEFGKLTYKYYCDYESEDKFADPPLVKKGTKQLFPKSDFTADIAERKQKEEAAGKPASAAPKMNSGLSVGPANNRVKVSGSEKQSDYMKAFIAGPGSEEYEQKAKEDAAAWLKKYKRYLSSVKAIDFKGKNFVFSGLCPEGDFAEKNDPVVLKIIGKDGQYKSKVSGKTDYLVVDPAFAGDSKIKAAIEQQQKGSGIKVILLSDLKKQL